MICIDFKKVFDTVSRDFLFRTLSVFGFGPSFVIWIHTFYINVTSCVLNNVLSTTLFIAERGLRRGDSLSAYILISVRDIGFHACKFYVHSHRARLHCRVLCI